ncbi:hypothetical protein N185_17640 [Sinorhizobium sp. GW3]|nr:hypothetical protein N185_17640 [Sinorhizobium sp. GW3]
MPANLRSLDNTDRSILKRLQADGRLSNRDLAEQINLSSTPCLRRVGMLEDCGVITRYKAVLDPERLGFTVRAFVQVTRSRESSRERVWEQLCAIPEVISCHVVSGEADLLLEIVARDMQHYGDILLERLGKIDGVYDSRSLFSIKSLKLDGDLPIDAK